MGWIAAAISVGGALIGGIGKADAQASSDQQKQNTDWGTQELRNTGQLENTQLQAEEAYYYKQLAEQQNMRGLDEFRKFSTVGQFAPTYTNTNPNPVNVPNAPTIPQQTAPTGLPGTGGGGGMGALLGGAALGGLGGFMAGNGSGPGDVTQGGTYGVGPPLGLGGTYSGMGNYGGTT